MKKKIIDRIKTFEDACNELGEDNPLVIQYHSVLQSLPPFEEFIDVDIIAYLKLRIIVAALNEGWTPTYKDGEIKWFPWFKLYTKEEIDNLKDKFRVLAWGGFASNGSAAGLGFASAHNGFSATYSFYGSRLCYRTKELAEYSGKQFIEIYRDFIYNEPKRD